MIDSEVRACIAAIALAHAKGREVTQLYDYDRDKHLNISARFSNDALTGLDLERKAQLSGTLPNLYDHVRQSYVYLTGTNGEYTGFDHKLSTHFSVHVNDNTLSLYDHGSQGWSQYSL